MGKLKSVIFKCNCEGDPCYFIDMVDEDKNPRPPDYCVKDGRGSRWKEVKKLPKKVLEKL